MRSEAATPIETVPCEGCRRGFARAVGDPEYLCVSCRRRMRIHIGEGTESDEQRILDAHPVPGVEVVSDNLGVFRAPHTTHPLECEACGRLFEWDSPHVRNDRATDYGFCPCGGTILFR